MDAHGWDERYRTARADSGSLWSAVPHSRLRQIADELPPGTALDLASGDGRNAIWLAGRGWHVTGVDFSTEGLDLARGHAVSRSVDVDWQRGDVTTWSPTRDFDLITMTYLHVSEPEIQDAVRRAASWLADGGTLIVIGHDRENLTRGAGGPQDPAILYTPELLRDAASGLRIVTAERIERDTRADPEGPPEDGAVAIDTLLHARHQAASA
ncbi:class I SAM-dependent methyltransferase [Spelaeicoccus albus]|uniref:SAM-dependent methyltransferase n=1 Tax=Spelaeicoccus albus TaxID=1280376 RepID=A0A7Z0D1K3_9MICO|nr:class I SAM-dependent methyltransferase [Spelaeicoccus albus]NYI67178.1 SAM-dependent methyltransferase [Spelaeicoccus albus]